MRRLGVLVAFSAVLTACFDDPDAGMSANAGSSSAAATTTAAETEAAVDTTVGPVATTAGDATGGSGTTGGADVCMPLRDDGDCAACSKVECCDEYIACLADPVCACLGDCLTTDSPVVCSEVCGIESPAFFQISQCAQRNCPQCVPADTCTPPPRASACSLCAAKACCEEYAACAAIEGCACAEDCMATGGSLDECLAGCKLGDTPSELTTLVDCAKNAGCTRARDNCYPG